MWVETDAACEVEVLGCRSRTFRVEGHHYALVHVTGLEPGGKCEYEVLLDGQKRWPQDDSGFPPSEICTLTREAPLKLVFGSCRISAPHEPPYTLSNEQDERGLGVDALYATALRLRDEPAENLPHALLLLGDQIYAHKPPFETIEFIRSRRDADSPPGEEAANFEEYARLYQDSWTDPAIRWLLSTVPSAMVFDDHEVSDDWNISESWVEEARTILGGTRRSLVLTSPTGSTNTSATSRPRSLPRTICSKRSRRPMTQARSSASSPARPTENPRELVGASTETSATRGW